MFVLYCSDVFIVCPLKHAVVKMDFNSHSIVPLDDEVCYLQSVSFVDQSFLRSTDLDINSIITVFTNIAPLNSVLNLERNLFLFLIFALLLL